MVEDFAPLLAAIRRVFPTARLTTFGDTEATAIQSEFPEVPAHYLNFLRHVGWGSLGDHFMLYSGLVQPDEIFDPQTAMDLNGILFFGDNFAGWMVGFDTRDGWRLVGVDSCFVKPKIQEALTVGEFFAQRASEWEAP